MQVGQAGRAKASAARAGLNLLEGLVLLAEVAGDLVEGQAGALAPGHGAGPGSCRPEGDASFHAAMIMNNVFIIKPPRGSLRGWNPVAR